MASMRAIFQAHVDDTFGLSSESFPVTLQWNIGTGAVNEIDQVDLVNGANTFTAPTGARMAIFVPPAGNGTAITLKGIAGDTGIGISSLMPIIITFAAAGSFVLNAAAPIPGCQVIYF